MTRPVAELTQRQRDDAVDLMERHGLNKCGDCCLVPDCPTCGPCDHHAPDQEAQAALDWARAHRIDGQGDKP